MQDFLKKYGTVVLRLVLLYSCVLPCEIFAKVFDEDIIKFCKNPKYIYTATFGRSASEINRNLYYVATIPELKEYYAHTQGFISFKDTSSTTLTALFVDDLIMMQYEITCEDKNDSIHLVLKNLIFKDKSFNLTHKSNANKFYFERIDEQIFHKVFAAQSIGNLSYVKELLPQAYDNAKYVKCVDDSLGCTMILNSQHKLCATCHEVETLTKAQADAFIKAVINVNVLNSTVMNCQFIPHDGLILYAKGKPVFKVELCFHCGEILFQNLITGKADSKSFSSYNVYKDSLFAKMIETNDGKCSKNKQEEMEYYLLKIKELKYELNHECK